MSARMKLRRTDGELYLDRRGWECRWFGVFLHRMEAPDPGVHLHNHPWYFFSIILKGGYIEERTFTNKAVQWAKTAQRWEDRGTGPLFGYPDNHVPRGTRETRRTFSIKGLGRNECHRIVKLRKDRSWSLVVHGPKRDRSWGFYLPTGYIDQFAYRDMYPDRVEDLTRDG